MFHPRGWLTQQIVRGPNNTVTTDDQITTFDQDARGNLTKVTSPDGSFATLNWHGRDQMMRNDEQLQDWMVYKYDSADLATSQCAMPSMLYLPRAIRSHSVRQGLF